MPTAYVLLNSDLGSDQSIINELKQILDSESGIEYDVQGVYGVYDIILKISCAYCICSTEFGFRIR